MRKLLSFTFVLLLLASCGKGPETITVDSDPLVPTGEQNFPEDTTAESNNEFIHIKLGELAAINSLDPLFATSDSELRTLNLLYDGLTAVDASGKVQPALARSWEVNRDSTRFTFNLKTDVYFHNSEAFNSGIGRRFVASDVKFVFERMASIQVPDRAAEMFKNIRGFNAFHNEQTYVKNPAHRAIKSISGIEVRSDSTVLIITNKRSPDFLKKLAHPLASVYAKESVQSANPPIQKAVGTGPFYFVKKEDNTHILSINQDYYGRKPKLNRLDIISGFNESDRFKTFARGELDAIIELSPESILAAIDTTGKLLPGYSNQYALEKADVSSSYHLFYNEESDNKAPVARLLSSLNPDDFIPNTTVGNATIELPDTSGSRSGPGEDSFSITHTVHPTELYFINRLATKASSAGFSTSMNASYAISEEVSFSTRYYPHTTRVITWNVPLYVIMQDNMSGIRFAGAPWNMDLTRIEKSEGI